MRKEKENQDTWCMLGSHLWSWLSFEGYEIGFVAAYILLPASFSWQTLVLGICKVSYPCFGDSSIYYCDFWIT
jgi:hypothetical protein